MNSHLPKRTLNRRAGQAGFTLVELVTVILILGVLAAVALPRYADLQGKARAAKVNGVLGSVKAAASLVKATAMANSVSCGAATVTAGVTLEGTAIDLNYCYPQGLGSLTTGIFGAANVSAADSWVIDGTKAGGSAAGTQVRINLGDAATPANCSITYNSPTAANGGPTFVSDTSGC